MPVVPEAGSITQQAQGEHGAEHPSASASCAFAEISEVFQAFFEQLNLRQVCDLGHLIPGGCKHLKAGNTRRSQIKSVTDNADSPTYNLILVRL